MFKINKKKIKAKKYKGKTGLQITVGHRTLADQNLLVSDEIPPVFGDHIRRFYIILRQGSSTKIYLNMNYIKLRAFFGDVRPKFCSVRPRWCLSRTYVLSQEKKYYLRTCKKLKMVHLNYLRNSALAYSEFFSSKIPRYFPPISLPQAIAVFCGLKSMLLRPREITTPYQQKRNLNCSPARE